MVAGAEVGSDPGWSREVSAAGSALSCTSSSAEPDPSKALVPAVLALQYCITCGWAEKVILQVSEGRALRVSSLEVNLLAKGKLNGITCERGAAAE